MAAATNSSPPLRVWLYGAILAASVLASLVPLRLKFGRDMGVIAAAYTQRFLIAPSHQDSARVVGLGSSLLWAATPPAAYESLEGVHWMRLTKSGGGIGYLRAVFDVFDKTPPSVLVIDANLLLPSTPAFVVEEMRYAFTQAVSNVLYPVMERIGIPHPLSQKVLSDQRRPFGCEPVQAEALKKQTARWIREQNAFYANAAVDPEIRDRLMHLAQRGVRIVVLELRRSAPLDQGSATEKQRWLERWQAVLPPGPSVSYLISPVIQDAAMYCDGRHMNALGASRFTPWWTAQLQQMAKGY